MKTLFFALFVYSILVLSACGGSSSNSAKTSATPYPMDADLKEAFPKTVELPQEITFEISSIDGPGHAKLKAKKFIFSSAENLDPYRDLILQDMFPVLVDRRSEKRVSGQIVRAKYCAPDGAVSDQSCGRGACGFDACFPVYIGRYPTATQAEEARRQKEKETPDWQKKDGSVSVDWTRGNLLIISPNGFVF